MEDNCAIPTAQLSWFSRLYITLRIRLGHLFYEQPRSHLPPSYSYGDRVARIAPKWIIKRGSLLEVETMIFLLNNTSLPIPRVRKVWADPPGREGTRRQCCFVMEYVVGETWDIAWKHMSIQDKEEAILRVRGWLRELRTLDQVFNRDQQVGAVGFQSCWDLRVSSSESFGPFTDIDSFYRHLLWKVQMIKGESKANDLFQKLTSLKPADTPSVVFTHADLAPRNIILHQGKVCGIIDWEQSGWWPYWWEYSKAFYAVQLKGSLEEEWRQFMESVLDGKTEEIQIDAEIRDIEGFPY